MDNVGIVVADLDTAFFIEHGLTPERLRPIGATVVDEVVD
jgi:hypothetical protein